jgi:hypothetical protein
MVRRVLVRTDSDAHRVALAVGLLAVAVGCAPEQPRFRGTHTERRAAPSSPASAPDEPDEPEEQPTIAAPATTAPSLGGWNEAQIHWETFAEGTARARTASRPVLLVISATWCGHCRVYSHVFDDPRIVEQAGRFVMVHVDQDAEREIAMRYVADGHYVPRTYFLAPDGTALPVTAANPRFRYFYDEASPASLLAGMNAALAQVGG